MLHRPLVVAAALLAAAPAFAAEAIAVSVERLARESDAVVRGRVVSANARKTDDGKRIFTTYEVRPTTVLRGAPAKLFRVAVPGGVVGKMGQRVDAAPNLAVGEDVVLFLERAGKDSFRVAGLAQGKFSVAGQVARPDLSQLQFVQTSVSAGERRAEEMPLQELERRVRSTK